MRLRPTPHPGRWAALAFVAFLIGLYKTVTTEPAGWIASWGGYTIVMGVCFIVLMDQHSRRYR